MANNERTKLEVDPELYSVVANSTGFPENKITIMAYSENCFIDKEGLNITAKDVVQVVLIILILGLLAYVVVRSMMVEKTKVVEEEISVEDILQSNPEFELQNVDMEAKSEARRMIEKFVDDNPEAVAGLLKTWLNQEWGG
jgi:flagellar M-ring protein FliF